MPVYKSKVIAPEEAIALGLCAECAADLAELDTEAHIAWHWPSPLMPIPEHAEAARRIALMREYAEKRKLDPHYRGV